MKHGCDRACSLPSTSTQPPLNSKCEIVEEVYRHVPQAWWCSTPSNVEKSKTFSTRRKPYKELFIVLLLLACSFSASYAADESGRMDRVLEALMVESLRNNLVQACDNEKITLHCPRNTHILIQNSFYGRLVPSQELCPGPSTTTTISLPTTTKSAGDSNNSTSAGLLELPSSSTTQQQQSRRRPPDSFPYEDTSCDFAEAHNKITELCRSKRKCRIVVKASFFGDRDPCPSTSKYLQISYKCKPISFEDQNFCQGTTMQLACKPNKRLSIYSAQYGHTVNGQAMHCSSSGQQQVIESLPQDCVRDVLPEILKACHAQTDCSIGINDHVLGNPCSHNVQKYLSLIYMCVNDEVFSEAALKGTMDSMDELEQELELKRKQSPSLFAPLEPDEGHHQRRHHLLDHQAHGLDEKADFEKSSLEHEVNSDYGIEQSGIDLPAVKGKESEVQQQSGPSNNKEQQEKGEHLPNAVGIAEDFLSFAEFIKANKEKSLLYFFLSASTGVILLLLACIFYQRKARSKEKKQANLLASRNHQTISVCRLPQDKSGAELSSLIGSSSQSNHTSPLYLDSDDSRNCVGLDNGIIGPSTQSMADYCGVGTGNGSGNYIYGGSPALQHQIYHSSGSSHSSAEKFSGIRTTSRGGTTRSARNDYQWGSMGNPTGKYTRYSHVTPPRIPPSLHYYN